MDTTSKSLRILAVDISGRFRTYWEINQGKEDSQSFNDTVADIASKRQGFDRIAICCDTGRSFRRAIWPEYKGNRTDPGEGYRHQLQRTIEQLEADGCSVFRAPVVNISDDTGEAYYAEADDVIGTLAGWAKEAGHFLRIYSADKDMCQLLSDSCDRLAFNGELTTPDSLIAKLGVSPSLVPDYLALVGDTSDNFKAFPGIGAVKALGLLRYCGSALGVFAPDKLATIHTITGDSIAKLLRTEGAKERAERCLRVATVLRDVELSFDPLLAEPVYKQAPAAAKIEFAPRPQPASQVAQPAQSETPAAPPPPASDRKPDLPPLLAAGEPARPSAPAALVKRGPGELFAFNPMALEPADPREAMQLAQTAALSQLYKKFPNPEAIMMVLIEGRSLGIPAAQSLKNAYIVKGNVGWSALCLVGLCMKSGLCDYFDIVESDMDRAVAVCKRVGRPEFRVVSTTEMAQKRGLIKAPGSNREGRDTEGNKWATDPLSMNLSEVRRRGARMGWPDVVSGLYTPDELEMGRSAEGIEILEAA